MDIESAIHVAVCCGEEPTTAEETWGEAGEGGIAGPRGLTGKDGLLKKLTAALINKALDAEMSEHLGYDSRESPPEVQIKRRNGHRTKKARSGRGPSPPPLS